MLRSCFLLAIAIALAAGGGWIAFVRRDRVAPLGEELLFDDFGFSVKGVRCSKTLGPPERAVAAKGTFWIVDLQVANHALRVGYKLSTHQAVIVDEQGRMFAASKDVETGASQPDAELPHGESCLTRLVFDLPEDAREPRVRIRFGGVGSALDYLLLGDWSLSLH